MERKPRSVRSAAAGVGWALLSICLLVLQFAGPIAAPWIPDYVAIPFLLIFAIAIGVTGVYFALRSIGDELEIRRIRQQFGRDRWRAKIGDSNTSTAISYRYLRMIGFLCFAALFAVTFLLGFVIVPEVNDIWLSVATVVFLGGGFLLFGSVSYWYLSRLLHRDPAIVFDKDGISHSLLFSRPHRVSWGDIGEAELIEKPIEIFISQRIFTIRRRKKNGRSDSPLFGISLLHIDASAGELVRLIDEYSRQALVEEVPINV